MKFEQDLRRALRPEEPPSGFEARVIARVIAGEGGGAASSLVHRRFAPRRWLAAAAVFFLAMSGAWFYERERMDDQAAARAARDAQVALRLASEKVLAVQRRINNPGGPEF